MKVRIAIADDQGNVIHDITMPLSHPFGWQTPQPGGHPEGALAFQGYDIIPRWSGFDQNGTPLRSRLSSQTVLESHIACDRMREAAPVDPFGHLTLEIGNQTSTDDS